jgi:hypothetical protein
MIEFVIWILVCALSVGSTVEVLHHSKAGEPWRRLGKWLEMCAGLKWLSAGFLCPFCYCFWWSILFVTLGAFMLFSPIPAITLGFIGGLAAARLANLLNDATRSICRTPNLNEESYSARQAKLYEDETHPLEE